MRTTMLLLMFAVAATAGDNIHLNVKLGLWETTQTGTMSQDRPPALPPDALAKLTPEQRAKLEALARASSGSSTRKDCVTKEQLDKGIAFGETPKNCTRTIITSTSTQLDMHMQCVDQGKKSDFTMHTEVLSSESVKGSWHMTASEDGHTMNLNSTYTSKWLGPACGNVK